jgi:hypothetical protein
MATEYRLSLTKTGAALSAQWVLDGAATTPLPIAPKLAPEDLAEHRWYLEDYILLVIARPTDAGQIDARSSVGRSRSGGLTWSRCMGSTGGQRSC